MRQINPAIKSLLKHNNISELRHKLLLYRRKWNMVTSAYIIETDPIDITDAINHNGTNVSIAQQLDNDTANVWKVGNLALTLYNENNRFWQDKEDGLFPQPYIIYGSKIEYYIGSPALNDYVKCFTGYLTELPTYRQDEGFVEIRALNRFDWLKTISAESVSTKVVWEKLQLETPGNTKRFKTDKIAVGRIKIFKVTSSSSDELTEKTDYTVSQLNDGDNSAIIELTSALLSGEEIYADYIYWYKGIMIDELVKKLLIAAEIYNHEKVDSVVFQNNAILYRDAFENTLMRYCATGDSSSFINNNNAASYDSLQSSTSNGTASPITSIPIYKKDKKFSIAFNFNFSANNRPSGIAAFGGLEFLNLTLKGSYDYVISVGFYLLINGNLINTVSGTTASFVLSYDNGFARLFRNGLLWWSGNIQDTDTISINSIANRFITTNIQNIRMSPIAMTDYSQYNELFLNDIRASLAGPKIYFSMNGEAANFLSWLKFQANVDTNGAPNPKIYIRDSSDGINFNNWVGLELDNMFSNFNKYIEIFTVNNVLPKNNEYNLSIAKISSYITDDITLGVCNLTNMSVLQALQDLAAMSMYEIGFDAEDKFFFRKRQQLPGEIRELSDDEIISMSNVKYDIDRLKTRIVVTYGEFNKIIDSDEMDEERPTNKDKYGERTYEISGSQLLPADNVDLAYAIAPTVYEELSKLRLRLSIDIVLDLQLELGDYVRILHNNNLWTKKEFTDYTKWKETGTYYMKCKVVGIRTDFNKRITTLDLIDYTEKGDTPTPPKTEDFVYLKNPKIITTSGYVVFSGFFLLDKNSLVYGGNERRISITNMQTAPVISTYSFPSGNIWSMKYSNIAEWTGSQKPEPAISISDDNYSRVGYMTGIQLKGDNYNNIAVGDGGIWSQPLYSTRHAFICSGSSITGKIYIKAKNFIINKTYSMPANNYAQTTLNIKYGQHLIFAGIYRDTTNRLENYLKFDYADGTPVIENVNPQSPTDYYEFEQVYIKAETLFNSSAGSRRYLARMLDDKICVLIFTDGENNKITFVFYHMDISLGKFVEVSSTIIEGNDIAANDVLDSNRAIETDCNDNNGYYTITILTAANSAHQNGKSGSFVVTPNLEVKRFVFPSGVEIGGRFSNIIYEAGKYYVAQIFQGSAALPNNNSTQITLWELDNKA